MVHEIIIGAKWRQLIRRGTSNQNGQGNGIRKDVPSPGSEAGFSWSLVKKQDKKDEGAQDLGLVCSWTATMRIKLRDKFQDCVKIKIKQFLTFLIIEVKGILGVVAGEPAAISADNGSILVVALQKSGLNINVSSLYCVFVKCDYIYNKGAVFAGIISENGRTFLSVCQNIYI